jgi:2-oxoglutarate ferredoxin oxidoreductase subunit alpha
MNIAWKYQIPAFILSDKTLSEGVYGVNPAKILKARADGLLSWDGTGPYRRYADTPSGISPLAFPGTKGAVVKVNSYSHDEYGITSEDADSVIQMTKKRIRKATQLSTEMENYETVCSHGSPDHETTIVCWGSTQGVCFEVADELGLRVIQPVVLSPFPKVQFANAMRGTRHLIAVEENATGQLSGLLRLHGISPDATVLHFDGRPLTPDKLLPQIREVIA